jgi:hypothetical protein
MKTQPELQTIPMPQGSCNADSHEGFPALQVYAPGDAVADRRHEHVLRAALLANSCTIHNEAVETH